MDPTPEQLAALATNLSSLASKLSNNPDQATQKVLQQQLTLEAKKVIWQCQPPMDAIMDHVVNAFTIGAISSLLEIGVFEAIPPVGSATVKEIAEKCNADEELIIRLMRQPACADIFTEVKLHEWAHNRLSIGFSNHAGPAAKFIWGVAMDEMYPALHHFNQYMKKFGKKDIHTYTNTPHSWQNNMLGSNFWEVLGSTPERLDTFNRCLTLFSSMHPVVAMFPFEAILQKNSSPTRALAVDIGGGRGHAMLALRTGCPTLQGDLIVQDRQVVLDEVNEEDLPGVSKMPHDFFTEQPVKNAQVYFIRRVMHDWLDEDAAKILSSIKPAMGPDSRILVSDMALPEPAGPQAAHAIWLDLMMMTIGGKERTHRDWEKLAGMAGLKLVKIWQEPEKYGPLCMVEYMLPDSDEATVSENDNHQPNSTNGVNGDTVAGDGELNGTH